MVQQSLHVTNKCDIELIYVLYVVEFKVNFLLII